MQAGRLDRRVTIEEPTEIRDAYGATVPGWIEVATVWASVVALMPRELRADSAPVSGMAYRLTMRYRSDILPSHRVRVDGKTMLVRGVAEIGRRQWTQLLCEQIT